MKFSVFLIVLGFYTQIFFFSLSTGTTMSFITFWREQVMKREKPSTCWNQTSTITSTRWGSVCPSVFPSELLAHSRLKTVCSLSFFFLFSLPLCECDVHLIFMRLHWGKSTQSCTVHAYYKSYVKKKPKKTKNTTTGSRYLNSVIRDIYIYFFFCRKARSYLFIFLPRCLSQLNTPHDPSHTKNMTALHVAGCLCCHGDGQSWKHRAEPAWDGAGVLPFLSGRIATCLLSTKLFSIPHPSSSL